MAEFLQTLKDRVASSVPLPAPVILGLLGVACLVITCLVFRKPLTWRWALVPGLLLGLLIEAWEIWDHYSPRGFQETSVPGVIARHLLDVLVLNLPAILIFGIAHLRKA